jgi:hypothetical protein
MFSIRKPAITALIIGMGMLAGCQVEMKPHDFGPAPLSSTPITTDQAMEVRQWDLSVASYANDAVLAHPTYSPLQPDRLKYDGNAILEPILFLGDVVYIPVGMIIKFPWEFEVNKSISAPASYTLMPPLPDGAESCPTF